MIENHHELVQFLIEAKQKAYAGEGQHAAPSRPASIDLPYQRGDYSYLDTYLGGFRFIGEEAVWHKGQTLWGMNYFGWMLVEEMPEGFSHFLKQALLKVTPEAPYRGPTAFKDGAFEYRCSWEGTLERYEGRERILLAGRPVYELVFHGGTIR